MLRKLCPPRSGRVFDDDFQQPELRSSIFIINPLNQDDCDCMGTADPRCNRCLSTSSLVANFVFCTDCTQKVFSEKNIFSSTDLLIGR